MNNNFKLSVVIVVLAIALIGAGFYVKYQNDQYSTADLPLPVDIGGGIGGEVPKDSGITGRVTVGPTCNVIKTPPDPKCADKPLSTDFKLLTTKGDFVKDFSSDEGGNFRVDLYSGEYIIKSTLSVRYPKMIGDGLVKVSPNKFTNFNIKFDSGIQ